MSASFVDKHNRTIIYVLVVLFTIAFSAAYYFHYRYYEVTDEPIGNVNNLIKVHNQNENTDSTNPKIKKNYFPIQYSKYSKQFQSVAQTFILGSGKTLRSITLEPSFGVGNEAYLDLYVVQNLKDFSSGILVASGVLPTDDIVKQEPNTIQLDQTVQLNPGVDYVIVISVKDEYTQTGIAFSEVDTYEYGKMYKYTRLIGGNGSILSNAHSWQPENNQDLIFTLNEY